MKFMALAMAALVLSGCDRTDVILPPAEYDHPYSLPISIQTVSLEDVPAACGLKGHIDACAFRHPLACRVIYPRVQDVGTDKLVALIRHETAHCNGWPANHPGGHY